MKKKLAGISAALFAILGISQAALAESGSQFIPVENLLPEQRQQVYEKISEMTNGIEPDWDQVVAGINGEGQAILMQKNMVSMGSTGQPSCSAR